MGVLVSGCADRVGCLVGVVGVLWLIGRVARMLGGE